MAQADVEATIVEPPPKKARVSREHEDKYDTAKLELAKTEEDITTCTRKIRDQKEGENRLVIIAGLEKVLKEYMVRKAELADIIADIEEAWGGIANAEQSQLILQCVSDLDKLLTNASPE